ncbi:hypothetical protein DAI22_08g030100 [Oryza sativa Japonica Group]|nr:hypothetical protein DAI22_08g030100 [Oryza sativa Japonica Group]
MQPLWMNVKHRSPTKQVIQTELPKPPMPIEIPLAPIIMLKLRKLLLFTFLACAS